MALRFWSAMLLLGPSLIRPASGRITVVPPATPDAKAVPETGVSSALADTRGKRVSGLKYSLIYTLVPHADATLYTLFVPMGAWLSAFVEGQHTAEAQAIVHGWLARGDIDPDLRLKVLQVSDELDER